MARLTASQTLTRMAFKKIFEFPVLHAGWEMDAKGWVIEKEDGTRAVLLTKHDANEYEAPVSELIAKLAEYGEATIAMEHALYLLKR